MRIFPFIGFTKSKLLQMFTFYSFFIDNPSADSPTQILNLNRYYAEPDFVLTHVMKSPGKRFCFKLNGANETVLGRSLLHLNKEAPEWVKCDNGGLKLNSPFNYKSKIQREIANDLYVRRYSDFYGRSLYFKIYKEFFKLIRK